MFFFLTERLVTAHSLFFFVAFSRPVGGVEKPYLTFTHFSPFSFDNLIRRVGWFFVNLCNVFAAIGVVAFAGTLAERGKEVHYVARIFATSYQRRIPLFLSRDSDELYNHEILTPAPQSVCVHIYNYLIINS